MSKEEIKNLEELILYHKRKYYDGETEISDAEFDSLEERLRILDANNPVLFIVGTKEGEDKGKVKHDPPMLSCQKAKTVEEVLKWSNDKPITIGYKVDGLSLKLVYNNSRLIVASTRGSGLQGDDVTINILRIESIPKTIPFDNRIEVRGELYMEISEFNRINKDLLEIEKYSNPRNLAAGTIKQKDSKIVNERKLKFEAWDLLGYGRDTSVDEQAKILSSWGFDSSYFHTIEEPDYESISKPFKKVEEERERLDFEIDGVVFKYNLANHREEAGETDHHPRWQIALKFESKGKTTTLKDITWQVGRTAVLTPVAELEPVKIAGAVISRATLHNAEFLLSLDANQGDIVYVERSGEVIPKIIKVTSKNTDLKVQLPKKCPSCGAETRRIGVNLVCTGDNCREKEIQQIKYWIKITKIDGLGGKSLEKLYDLGLLKHYSDLYSLTEEQLVEHLGKNGSKIYQSINSTRELPFHIFLAGLGIETLGRTMGKKLVKHFTSLEELKNASINHLTELEGISDITAKHINKGINEEERYENLFKRGLIIIPPKTLPKKKRPATGAKDLTSFFGKADQEEDEEFVEMQRIYITGKVEGYIKNQLEQLAEDHGFEWVSSVSKRLDMLVYGENAGKLKLEKAEKLGVKTIPWEKFYKEYINKK